MHRAERAQICYKLTDTRCDTRGYRHARASYGPPRATRAANGPGTIGRPRSRPGSSRRYADHRTLWRQLVQRRQLRLLPPAGCQGGGEGHRAPSPHAARRRLVERCDGCRCRPRHRRAAAVVGTPAGRPVGDSSCRCREACGITTRLAADNKSIHAKSTRDVCCDRQGACRTCL